MPALCENLPVRNSVGCFSAAEEPRALCVIRDMTTCDSPEREKLTLNLPASTTGEQLLQEVATRRQYERNTFELVLQRMPGGESVVVNNHPQVLLSQMGFHCCDNRRNMLIIGDKNGQPPRKFKVEHQASLKPRAASPPPPPADSEQLFRWCQQQQPPPPTNDNHRRPLNLLSDTGDGYEMSNVKRDSDRHAAAPPASDDSAFAPGYVGLVNQAMTCYLNSLLQTLFMTPEFRNALYRWEFVDDDDVPSKSIPYQLQRLFLQLQTSSRHAVETTELTRSFGWDSSEAWQQHDVQELCRVMFDALEVKFRDTDQADLIDRLYQGKIKDYVKCLECGNESAREDTYLDIPLPVRPFGASQAYGSVEEALQAFVQPEVLDGSNQYFCETCNRKCDAHKGLKFTTFPYLLTLQLKRFDFDYNTMHRIKLNDRVTFQDILNLNHFIKCEQDETSFDDASTVDSGSAFDEADNTSALSSGGGCDNQEDDEGIDMDGSHHGHETAAVTGDRNHLSQLLAKGPYLYELFSIMVHSGSANGGHYYAYIKSFTDRQWYCFNDQCVTKITDEDIRKTYGGGPTRSYYSGAYSSSTNAYMLMYRQMDGERNAHAMGVDDFPEHIRRLLRCTQQQEEKERQQRELERNMCKIKLYWNDPVRNRLLDAVLKVHKDTTLSEATRTAHQISGLDRSGLTPLQCCRLVKYDDAHDSLECSFEDGDDGEPIGELLGGAKSSYRYSLLLEVWPPDAAPLPVYRPGGTTIKTYVVNVKTEEVEGPVTVRAYLTQTVDDLKAQVVQQVPGLTCRNPRVVLERYYNDLRQLTDGSKTLKAEGFYRSNKIFVELSEDVDGDEDIADSAFQRILDRHENTIVVHVTLPDVSGNGRTASSDLLTNGTPPRRSSAVAATELDAPPPLDYDEGIGGECDVLYQQRQSKAVVVEHSDQSEDSSLTDSDRTIVGTRHESPTTAADGDSSSNYQRLDNILSFGANNSSGSSSSSSGGAGGGGGSNVSRPSSSCDNDRNLTSPEEENTKEFSYKEIAYKWDYGKDETTEVPSEEETRYFRATAYTDPTSHARMLQVRMDKRITLGALKRELEPHVGVPVDCFKIYRLYSTNQEYECTKLNENFVPFDDDMQLIVKVGRALRKGEYRVKIYQFVLNDPEPSRFLVDWILAKGMTVLQAKRDMLPEIKARCGLDVPLNRCRLRKKSWLTPATIYIDSRRFDDDIAIFENLEVYLEILAEAEKLTSLSQLSLYVRWWHPATFVLDPMQELVLDDYSLHQLKDKLEDISGIPPEFVDYAKGQGRFPHDISLLSVHTDLDWNPQVTHLNVWPMYICDDGHVVIFKDRRESLKQLGEDERREIIAKENAKSQRQGCGVYSPRKERALKIYTAESSSSSTRPVRTGTALSSSSSPGAAAAVPTEADLD